MVGVCPERRGFPFLFLFLQPGRQESIKNECKTKTTLSGRPKETLKTLKSLTIKSCPPVFENDALYANHSSSSNHMSHCLVPTLCFHSGTAPTDFIAVSTAIKHGTGGDLFH